MYGGLCTIPSYASNSGKNNFSKEGLGSMVSHKS